MRACLTDPAVIAIDLNFEIVFVMAPRPETDLVGAVLWGGPMDGRGHPIEGGLSSIASS
jgi:hypothetical protein